MKRNNGYQVPSEELSGEEIEALGEDADREMIGDDVDYGLEDIGCK